MANAAAARHFERVAGGYTELRDSGLKGVLRRQEQRAVHQLAQLAPGDLVLDAGCGDGEILAWIASRQARPIGVDLVATMAAHCRRRGFDVCVQDMERLGFRAAFDWVLCIGSLEFTTAPLEALRSFAASLKPGGRLLLLFPRRGWLGHVYAGYHRAHGVRIWTFSHREVAALLEQAGLIVADWRECALSSLCVAGRRGAR